MTAVSNHDFPSILVLRQMGEAHFVLPRFPEFRPRSVAHDLGSRVWAWIEHSELRFLPSWAVRVGDGLTDGLDEHGLCLVSFPADHAYFLTQEEAQEIHDGLDVDAQILSWAR
jgi:hypothetical protein